MLLKNLRSRLKTAFGFGTRRRPICRARLDLESLDGRVLPAITFSPIDSVSFPAGKDLFVPLSAVDPDNPTITYSPNSSNGQVTAQVLSNTTNIVFHVSGKDGNGNDFSGEITLTLFNDLAPQAAARIIELVNSGFYDGRNFHRVIDGFMAQGGSVNGSGSGDSGLGKFDDEYQPTIAFTSRGLVALANAGDDTNDTQFFIVDTDLSLAQMPSHLNYNHTIVGLLTGGFDVFEKLMSTNTEPQNPPFNNENSKPVPEIIINSATVSTSSQTRVLRISAPSNFTGTSDITVTANSTGGATPDTETQSFTVTAVTDTVNDRPFLGPISDITTNVNSSVTIDLPATDVDGDDLTFVIRSATDFSAAPPNVTITINQATRQATITPNAGFTGSVDFVIGVRDQTNRGGGQLDDQVNFDTQVITLTVVNEIDLDASSDTGLYNDDNFTSDGTPSFTINAEAGRTVTVSVNGAGSYVATESATPGVYNITLPANVLRVGVNTIEATVTGGATPVTLAPLTITYAPQGLQGVYVVPGAVGVPQNLTIHLTGSQAAYKSELGFFKVDDASGRIGSLMPGDPGYAEAAINRAVTAMTNDKVAGASSSHTVNGGDLLGFYIIQNSTSTNWLANNPTNAVGGNQPLAFFSFTEANPDGVAHVAIYGDADGRMTIGFEDLTGGGDRDYNDRVMTIGPTDQAKSGTSFMTPAGASREVEAQFLLLPAQKSTGSQTTITPGEVGFFLVDDANGRIGNLLPGDPGYAEAALARRQQIFASGAGVNTNATANIPGSSLIGFYFISNGSAASFLSSNPTNSAGGSVHAFFSFSDANPDGADHFRLFNPEGVTRSVPTASDPLRIHASNSLNPTESSFDDLLFTVNFRTVGGNSAPVINSVNISPSAPTTDATVTATVNVTDPDGDTPSLTYVWKVNGSTVRTHTTTSTTDTLDLSVAGNGDRGQEITVEVTASDGTSTSSMVSDTVTVENSAPTASVVLTPAGDVFIDGSLTAEVTASDPDSDAVILQYVWKVNGTVVRDTGDTPSITDTLDLTTVAGGVQPGDVITVEVTPKDANDTGTVVTADKTIANQAPTGSVDDQSFSGSGVFTLDIAPFFSDPDGQTLTFTATLDDGSPLPAWLSISPEGVLSGNPPASAIGSIDIKVTGSDGSLSVSDTFTLTLSDTNDVPTVTADITPNPPDIDATLTATATVDDPDGDPVSLTYVWKVNGTVVRTTGPTTETTDTLDLTTVSVVKGDQVTVEITPNDGTVDGAMASDLVVVGNSAPTASVVITPAGDVFNDSVLIAEVTANDDDGDSLTYTYVWKINGTEVRTTSGTSLDTDTLDLATVMSGVLPGDVITVEVTANDGSVDSSLATDTKTITNRPPEVGTPIGTQMFDGPGEQTLDVSGSFSDPDGQPLTFTATLDDGSPLPAWLTISSDGVLSGNPLTSDVGSLNITVTASDGEMTVSDTFELKVTNSSDAPSATVVIDPETATSSSVLTATASGTDPDGDEVTFTYVWKVNGAIVRNSGSTTSTTDTLDLSTLSVVNGDTVTVEVTPNDGTLDGTVADASIVVGNSAPTVTVELTPQGDAYVTDLLTADAFGNDADGDSLTYTYVWKVNGTVVRTTSDTSSETDSLDLTQVADIQIGDTVTVEVTASDGTTTSAVATDERTLVNRAPQLIAPIGPQTFFGSGDFSLDVSTSFFDEDGQDLIYTATLSDGSPLPAWLTITSDGLLSGNPPASAQGDLEITVTASDGTLSTSDTFTLTLTSTNDTPSATVALSPSSPGTTAIVTATVSDVEDLDGDTVQFTYIWTVNGTQVKTTSNTTATTDTLDLGTVAGGVSVGDVVMVEVIPNDSIEDGIPVSDFVVVS